MKASILLKKVREKLGLTQEEMAGLLGINRSYLAELEKERRPVKDWIVAKAQEVERRMAGIELGPDITGDRAKQEVWGTLKDALAGLSNDELTELFMYLGQSQGKCPSVTAADAIFGPAINDTLAEIRKRLGTKAKK